MSRRSVLRRLLDPLLALSVLAGTQVRTPLFAQGPGAPPPARFPSAPPSPQVVPADVHAPTGPMRFARNVAGDVSPIILAADQVDTWKESDQIVVVSLHGKVLLQQGTVQVRCEQGIARFDLKTHLEKGIWQMDFYGEGQVRLDMSSDSKDGTSALIDLATRGEIKVSSFKGKVTHQAQADDLLYRRALAELSQAQPIQPVAGPSYQTGMPVPYIPPKLSVPPAPVPQASPPPASLAPGLVPPPPASLTPGPVPPTAPPPVAPSRPLGAAPAPDTILVRGQAADEATPRPPLVGPAPEILPVQYPGPAGGTAPYPPPSKPGPKAETAPTPLAGGRTFSVRPRYGPDYQISSRAMGNGEVAYILTGGVILNVRGVKGIGQVDLEADRVVVFRQGNQGEFGGFQPTQSVSGDSKLQFYLAGNVEMRELDPRRGERVLRADELYYDVDRSVAIALSARLETMQPPVPDPIVFRSEELIRVSDNQWEILKGELYSSKLVSDPGLRVYFTNATMEETIKQKTNILGSPVTDRTTGQPLMQTEDYVKAHNVFFELEHVPYFYLPYLACDIREPLGPVQSISAGYNSVFGAQFDVTFNAYELFGIQPLQGTQWRISLDEMTARGPAAGTEFDYSGVNQFLGIPAKTYEGVVKMYGIYDSGNDDLGGPRPSNFEPPGERGRVLWRQGFYDMPYGFTFQSQLGLITDRNFIEQYYKQEWDTDLPQNTYAYLKQQGDYWAWTGQIDGRIGQEWATNTDKLPEVDGWLFGLAPFDIFTSNTHASIGYFRLRTSNDPGAAPLSPTDVESNTARADIMEDLSLPFTLGAFRIVPYVQGDLSAYSQDLQGNPLARAWGGAGIRASIPFTRLFPDVQSELFNVNGINHKILFSANYFVGSDTASHLLVPQLDRLNDETSDQSVRDVREFGYNFIFDPTKINLLRTSPLYDPQYYAMRSLLYDNNPDLLDTMQVLQLDLYQRWQTKRGFPGAEHVVDWMTLDLGASYFPAAQRDNFGQSFAFLNYDWVWNIGDRTALVSSGLVDPIEEGEKIFTFGAYLNRTDRTSFYLGYAQIEPLESRLVTASVTYVFSPKYAMTLSTAYDFGPDHVQSSSLVMTRTGTDLQVSMGLSYNSLQSNVGFIFEIVPNLAANMRRGGFGSLSSMTGSGGPLH